MIYEIWDDKDKWIMSVDKRSFLVQPSDQISPDIQPYVREGMIQSIEAMKKMSDGELQDFLAKGPDVTMLKEKVALLD